MSKQHKIRWTASDDAELKRAVKNFNAKIVRLEKKNPAVKSSLPDRVTVKEMRELIQTRKDLKKELKSLQNFTKRGAETLVKAPNNADDNIFITKWQRDDMLARQKSVNISRGVRRANFAKLQAKDRGKELAYTVGGRQTQIGMGKAEEKVYMKINAFTPTQSKWDIRERHKTLRKESQSQYWTERDKLLRDNYIKSIERNFRDDDAAPIIAKIKSMDLSDYMKLHHQEDLHIEDNYTDNEDDYQKELSKLNAVWFPNK